MLRNIVVVRRSDPLRSGTLKSSINPLKAELNPICHLLGLLYAHHIPHVSGLRVNQLQISKYASLLLNGYISLFLLNGTIVGRITRFRLSSKETH